ncbi:MAG: HAMP domain-containing protein [Anaerolineaceae bacterium]|nr:HAMP domain-containing protein [Anaerolineaceae bacterium]
MRWRLLGSFALIILIALGTVAVVARYTTQQEVETFLIHGGQIGLENLATNLEEYYAENGSWTGAEGVSTAGSGANTTSGTGSGRGQGGRSGTGTTGDNAVSSGNPSAGVNANDHVVTDPAGTVVLSPDEAEVGTQIPENILSQSIALEVDGELVGYLIPDGGIVDLPDDFDELLIERVNNASLLAAGISGGIAIVLALILSSLILRPVHGLTKAANQMAEGDLSQRVKVRGGGELSSLGKSFNKMAESLEDAEDRRQSMTADIAHELRNPLAIQRAHLEALQDGVYPLTLENLALIGAQNQQLTRLVNDLRTLALVDAGELSLNMRNVDLNAMCADLAARFQPQADGKKVGIESVCPSGLMIALGDKERLQQVLDNLMQNALRYTPEGGMIEISLQRQGHSAIFAVHNNGPSIPNDVLEHLFERFYRGDKARDRASGGTGLGLAIARKLAEAHGGSLIGENHPAGGVVFKLVLPLNE